MVTNGASPANRWLVLEFVEPYHDERPPLFVLRLRHAGRATRSTCRSHVPVFAPATLGPALATAKIFVAAVAIDASRAVTI